MIIAFLGVIGSGKDHRAQGMHPAVFKRVDFKDELLDMASDLAGYDVREDYDWFKEHVVGVRRPGNQFMATYEGLDRNRMAAAHPEILTGRRLLQRLGTDVMRKRDSEYWVNAYRQRVAIVAAQGYNVVTADCRFMNEVAALRELRASFTFCNYRSPRYTPDAPHESEKLAQALLRLGLSDGQAIQPGDFARAEAAQ